MNHEPNCPGSDAHRLARINERAKIFGVDFFMTSVSTLPIDEPAAEEYEPYRAISKGAVVSVILGLMSISAFSLPALSILALIGFFIGFNAFRTIRRYPTELSGKVVAVLGTALCALMFGSTVTFHSVTYATEVPPGYERVSFADLQPLPQHPELPVSPAALDLNRKKVFIKGYIYPDGQQANIKKFVLVPDMGTCCFGGQPKLTHMMEVTLTDPQRVKYSMRKRKLAGELIVDTSLKPIDGLGGVYFQLKADHVQ
jgi:xanthosine utilization system XapX-like protein